MLRSWYWYAVITHSGRNSCCVACCSTAVVIATSVNRNTVVTPELFSFVTMVGAACWAETESPRVDPFDVYGNDSTTLPLYFASCAEKPSTSMVASA